MSDDQSTLARSAEAERTQVGQRFIARASSLPPDVARLFADLQTTNLSDAMSQAYTMDPGIRPLYASMVPLLGSALTVSIPSGSQSVRRAAIASAAVGDVLVIAAGSASAYAVLGGRLARILADKGVAGVVIDGCARDFAEIVDIGLPVYCRGRSPASGPKEGPGEINVAVACGGVVVNPGDVIVGDEDGVVVIPRSAARSVAARAVSMQNLAVAGDR